MSSVLSGLKIAVLGGDARELVLIAELVNMGATVAVVGFPEEMVLPGAYCLNSIEEACREAEVVILPLPGTNAQGHIRAVYYEGALILTEKAIKSLAENAVIIIGSAQQYLKNWAKKFRYNLLEIIENDELAILNSIPTAEGAIQIAIAETKITLHKSKSCVIGLGRVGLTLARLLKALGSEVTVISREKAEIARAYEMGCQGESFASIGRVLSKTEIAFNTVPDQVLTQDVLAQAYPEIVIIDLANQPGGTDFEAADELGIKAILAPGLPGKVAPLTAGKILADVIPKIIMNTLEESCLNLFYRNKEVQGLYGNHGEG